MNMPVMYASVIEIAHGAEGDDEQTVVVVIAALDFALINTDHFKAQSIDADILSERLFAGEKPAPGFVADHRNSRALRVDLVR